MNIDVAVVVLLAARQRVHPAAVALVAVGQDHAHAAAGLAPVKIFFRREADGLELQARKQEEVQLLA